MFGGLCSGRLGHQDPSPSHTCDVAWASGASLSHILSLAPGRGGLSTVLGIPSFLELSSRTRVVCAPRWDSTRIPISKASSWFLEGGTGLAEALLSHLFFLATAPGGNSWRDLMAQVLRVLHHVWCLWPAPLGIQTSGDPANTSFPLRAWPRQGTHIFAYPSIQGFIHSFIQHA